jgi:hypothetical protein
MTRRLGTPKGLVLALLGFALALVGCGGSLAKNPPVDLTPLTPPPPLTFELHNAGATSVFLFENCTFELSILRLIDPAQAVGLPTGGCGVCDCAASSCGPVACGACFDGGLEVAAGATQQYLWAPVDIQYETSAAATCSRSKALTAGPYRIDVPVFASADDASGGIGARIATATFTLPGVENVAVPLEQNP